MQTPYHVYPGPGPPQILAVVTKTVWPAEPEILTYLTLCGGSLLTPDAKGGAAVLEMCVEPFSVIIQSMKTSNKVIV